MSSPERNTLQRVIISGGGTGGHVYPALAIADEIKRRNPGAEIMFVGALGRMEMERVPLAGYPIIGLDIRGLDRKKPWKNAAVIVKILASYRKVKVLLRKLKPQIVIGVGGYASAPTLGVAGRSGYPTLVQEQNSYPGVTNKLLSRKARAICVAYPGLEQFFPAEKLHITGNPLRNFNPQQNEGLRAAAALQWNLNADKTTLLVIGGSLGARTLNEAMRGGLQQLLDAGMQVIWQTGKFDFDKYKDLTEGQKEGLTVLPYIENMALAYAAADIVVSRAGAMSISELSLLGKACIFVPSPNVAEDHQTRNAKALSDKGAAMLVPDADAAALLITKVLQLAENADARLNMEMKIKTFAKPTAAADIVDLAEKIALPA